MKDLPALIRAMCVPAFYDHPVTDAIHVHGSLAAIELVLLDD